MVLLTASRSSLRSIVVRTVLAATLMSGVAVAQSATTGAFVITLGSDTTAVEQYTRVGNIITGDLVVRLGGTVVNHYQLTLNPDGTPAILVVTPRRADGSVVPRGYNTARSTFTADSVVSVITADTTSMTRRIAAPRAFPLVGVGLAPSMAMYEVMFSKLRAEKADSESFVAVSPLTTRLGIPSWVKFFGADSARIWLRFGPPTPAGPYAQYVHVDRTGRVLGFNGLETTQKIVVHRLPSLDVAKLANEFAASDAAKIGIGARATSLQDSVRATIGVAHIAVNYWRPFARGRDLFKDGVLGDTLWRTGANTATSFTTDVDLVIGGTTIPAGAYTLWTHVTPGNRSYELIFNKQTGQWGTDYHPEQDLARVPLRVSRLSSPIEAFQIAVRPAGRGGTIALDWANTELSVEFGVKPR
jgi:hypothetical protein